MIRLREHKKNLKLNVNLEYTGHAFFKRKNSNKHLPFNMTILFKIEEIENPLKIVFIWTNSSKFKELVKFNSIAIIIKKEICGYPQFPHVPSAHHCRCCHRLFFIFLERCVCLFSWCFDIFIRIATIIRLSLSMSIILLQQRGNEKATTKFWPSQQNSPRNWQKG